MMTAITLRAYQTSALTAVQRGITECNPLADLPTGTGKSIVLAELCNRHAVLGHRLLVLSHVREIIDQDRKAILSLWNDAPIGINSDALGERNTTAPIVLATIQSVFRNPRALGHRDIVIVDEAHLVPHGDDGMYRGLIAALREINPRLRVVGFTATPYRLDSGRLDEGDGRLFDKTVFTYTIREAIEDGWLAKLRSKATTAKIDVAGVHRRGGEFVDGELQEAAMRGDLVQRAVEEMITRAGERRAWLIFCCGVEHAFRVRDVLHEHGGIPCETIVGETPAHERAQIIEDFRAGRITAVTNCQCLTTGFDVPHIDLIALLRPTLSTGLYVQMVGRGTRLAEGKDDCLVLDFAGNVSRHGPVDAVDPRHGKSDDSKGEPLAKLCPMCDALVPLAARACPDCGYVFPGKKEKHEETPTEAPILSTGWKWIAVESVSYRVHYNRTGSKSLRVNYLTEDGESVSEWLAFEGSSGARFHAERKWRRLGGKEPVPATAAEAVTRIGELTAPERIATEPDGDFTKIVAMRVNLNEGAPA